VEWGVWSVNAGLEEEADAEDLIIEDLGLDELLA
jgi:hypothetical protein